MSAEFRSRPGAGAANVGMNFRVRRIRVCFLRWGDSGCVLKCGANARHSPNVVYYSNSNTALIMNILRYRGGARTPPGKVAVAEFGAGSMVRIGCFLTDRRTGPPHL